MRPVEIELRLTMSKILPLKCLFICLCRDCPQTRVVLLRGRGKMSISSTCILTCRQDTRFCLCVDRRISVFFFSLHKSKATSQRLANSVRVRHKNTVSEQSSAKNYHLFIQRNPTYRARGRPRNWLWDLLYGRAEPGAALRRCSGRVLRGKWGD